MAPDTWGTLAAGVACYAGLALIAVTQDRHRSDLTGAPPEAGVRRAWPVSIGVTALAIGLALSVRSQGVAFGSLVWVLLTCAMALAVALTLSWWPQALAGLARRLALSRRT